MLDKEFNYYLEHQNELLPLYDGKYVMIVGNKVVGAYNTINEAYYKGKDKQKIPNYQVIREIFVIILLKCNSLTC